MRKGRPVLSSRNWKLIELSIKGANTKYFQESYPTPTTLH